jgi:hypothetical protein
MKDRLLRATEYWSPQIIELGGTKILVVDNALSNPYDLRDFANSLDYDLIKSRSEFRVYPGERATVSWSVDTLMDRIRCAYERLAVPLPGHYQRLGAFFTRMNPIKMNAIHPRQQAPHVDMGQSIVAIVHLSHEDVAGMTGFYRHIRTGIQNFTPSPSKEIAAKMRQDGFNPLIDSDYNSFVKSVLFEGLERYAKPALGTGLRESNDIWNLLGVIPGKFNRLVAFPGAAIHSPLYRPKHNHVASRVTLNLAFIPT